MFPQCDIRRRDRTGERPGLSCQYIPSDQSCRGRTYKTSQTLFTSCNAEGECIQDEAKLCQQTDNDLIMTSSGVEMIDCSGIKVKNKSVNDPDSIIYKTEDPLNFDMIPQSTIKTENMEDCVFVKEEFEN